MLAISCELSAGQKIHMNCQALWSRKIKKKKNGYILGCHLVLLRLGLQGPMTKMLSSLRELSILNFHILPCSTTLQVNHEDSYKTMIDHNDLTCCFAIFISTKEALRFHVVQMRSSHDASQYQRY